MLLQAWQCVGGEEPVTCFARICPAAFWSTAHAGLPYLRANSRTLWSITSICFDHKLLRDLFPDEVAPAQPPSPMQGLPSCLHNLCSFCNQALTGPVLERLTAQQHQLCTEQEARACSACTAVYPYIT